MNATVASMPEGTKTPHNKATNGRNGNIIVLTALMLILFVGILAFTVDVGYLVAAKAELQRSADAAALAGAYQLISKDTPGPTFDLTAEIANARQAAVEYVTLNTVWNVAPTIGPEDIVIGYIKNPTIPTNQMTFGDPRLFNTVQVGVTTTVPFFFAGVLNKRNQEATARATAAILTDFGGFEIPSDGSNINILPFALDQGTWDGLMNGSGPDEWTWDPSNQRVTAGSDGVPEGSMYPTGAGATGNRGTVDIGGSNNSTADIKRQIVDGISSNDLAHLGGTLALGSDGTLVLNGDTGISAGVKSALREIVGKPRIIPIFSSVSGHGNNAEYTLVGFGGARVMYVELTGNDKAVIIQPCPIIVHGGIPSPTGTPTSRGIYSMPLLIR